MTIMIATIQCYNRGSRQCNKMWKISNNDQKERDKNDTIWELY